MEMDIVMKFITEGSMILIPGLWIIGMFLKRTPNIPDWLIIWILLVLGIVGSIYLNGLNASGIIQGVLVTGVSVLGHQLIKQTSNKG